jgi:hypothetical protein
LDAPDEIKGKVNCARLKKAGGRYKFNGKGKFKCNGKGKVNCARLKKAGGRYKFKGNFKSKVKGKFNGNVKGKLKVKGAQLKLAATTSKPRAAFIFSRAAIGGRFFLDRSPRPRGRQPRLRGA